MCVYTYVCRMHVCIWACFACEWLHMDMYASVCEGLRLILEIISLSFHLITWEARNLNQTLDLSIGLVLLASLLWGSPVSSCYGWNYRPITKLINISKRFRGQNSSSHACREGVNCWGISRGPISFEKKLWKSSKWLNFPSALISALFSLQHTVG